MKNPIKLNSQEWCDVVFKDKNKSYGAYEMRMTSSKRHVAAFLVTVIIAILVALIPTVINKVSAANNTFAEGLDEERILINVVIDEPIEEIIEMAVPEPPKPVAINSIQFVAPVIGEDSEIPDDLETPPMEDILADRRVIGYVNVEDGTDDMTAELARVKEEDRITEAPVAPISFAEIMPQFPGGEAEMMNFIGKSLRYPVVDQENGTQGRVTVRFVVTKTGDIDQVEVLRGVSPTCDREAMRVVKSMPRWIPGKQNGKPVAVYFTLPVAYKLK